MATNLEPYQNLETTNHLGMIKLSPDIWIILAAVSQLERDLIAERVRNGLANARAKGKKIRRAKLRDSDLIRKLHKAGLTYRAIATIAKCSHGSVHAELVSLKKEEKLKAENLLKEGSTKKQVLTEVVREEPSKEPSGPNAIALEIGPPRVEREVEPLE